LTGYAEEALSSWIQQFRDPAVVKSACEDYRAGASIDQDHDKEADKSTVSCETLILYGQHLRQRYDVEKIWREEKLDQKKVKFKKVGNSDIGHFIPLEAAAECAMEVKAWLEQCARV
jgi:haloacetate dehalogenase